MKPFGEVLKGIRERHELSQKVVSMRAGLTPSAVCRFESGQRQPERTSVARLADGLGADTMERRRLFHAAGFVVPGEEGDEE